MGSKDDKTLDLWDRSGMSIKLPKGTNYYYCQMFQLTKIGLSMAELLAGVLTAIVVIIVFVVVDRTAPVDQE